MNIIFIIMMLVPENLRVTDSVFVKRTENESYLFFFAIDDENYRYCFAVIPGRECPLVMTGFRHAFKASNWEWGPNFQKWFLMQSKRDFRILCACLLEAVQEYWSQDNVRRPVKVIVVAYNIWFQYFILAPRCFSSIWSDF